MYLLIIANIKHYPVAVDSKLDKFYEAPVFINHESKIAICICVTYWISTVSQYCSAYFLNVNTEIMD